MRIAYTGRNFDITPALKAHVRDKLGHTAHVLEGMTSARVTLTVEKHRHMAEIQVRARRGATLSGEAWSRDMYRSIAKAIDRIQVQVTRQRDKTISRKRRATGKRAAPTTVARAASAAGEEPVAPPQLVVERIDRVKPIAVEEALLLLEKARRPFVVFRNSATGRVAVVYRRRDDRFGLVEPDP